MNIPAEHIDAAIIALDVLRRNPDRYGREYYDALCALDRIIGNDALSEEIENAAVELGLVTVECLICGSSCGGYCDYRYEIGRDAA